MQAQSKLKSNYWLKKQLRKQDIFNKLLQIDYFSSENINNLDVKIVKILEKIKAFDIIIKEMVTIKLMNSLSDLFKIYLIMLCQKAINKNKSSNL